MTGDDAFGKLLRAMLGPPDPQPGPPYTHVHAFPVPAEEDEDAEEAWEPPPAAVLESLSADGQYENGPLEVPAAFRRLRAAADASLLSAERCIEQRMAGRYWDAERRVLEVLDRALLSSGGAADRPGSRSAANVLPVQDRRGSTAFEGHLIGVGTDLRHGVFDLRIASRSFSVPLHRVTVDSGVHWLQRSAASIPLHAAGCGGARHIRSSRLTPKTLSGRWSSMGFKAMSSHAFGNFRSRATQRRSWKATPRLACDEQVNGNRPGVSARANGRGQAGEQDATPCHRLPVIFEEYR